ncbi:MAG: restriction endonuclease subunit S [Burkholderiales bacterium]
MRWPWAVPPTWQWTHMGDIASVVGGGTPNTKRPGNFGGDIPWLTPADLSGYTAKRISGGARNLTQAGYNSSGARLIAAGSILFSSRAPIGYVAIAANPVCTNQGFKSFVLSGGLVSDFAVPLPSLREAARGQAGERNDVP